ncbi:hypothetical protein DSM3645_02443 [Blastopirellula marina DSM 3645]|uniref:Uncharacterized protein n=1 Tax=Blastopirellula marina DSM 3645 TaxID=314230 RepID=A3ZVF2_9BACT|nr:hypothetical protein DSM3645_02443 [Blastopirellula marina DSM 3645]
MTDRTVLSEYKVTSPFGQKFDARINARNGVQIVNFVEILDTEIAKTPKK